MFACNGGDGRQGECDVCRNRHCEKYIECDWCHEKIDCDIESYVDFGDVHYCSDCIDENTK